MGTKELKNLSRRELVDIIYLMKKNEKLLQDEIASLRDALQNQEIHLSLAGSIAEAAISVTNVFSSAQASADIYLREIVRMKRDAEIECAKMIDDTKQKTAEMISQRNTQLAILNDQYWRECVKWYKLHQKVQLLEKTSREKSHED
jgi:hypothetical protein